jgi:hypothetical protein
MQCTYPACNAMQLQGCTSKSLDGTAVRVRTGCHSTSHSPSPAGAQTLRPPQPQDAHLHAADTPTLLKAESAVRVMLRHFDSPSGLPHTEHASQVAPTLSIPIWCSKDVKGKNARKAGSEDALIEDLRQRPVHRQRRRACSRAGAPVGYETGLQAPISYSGTPHICSAAKMTLDDSRHGIYMSDVAGQSGRKGRPAVLSARTCRQCTGHTRGRLPTAQRSLQPSV